MGYNIIRVIETVSYLLFDKSRSTKLTNSHTNHITVILHKTST